MLFYFKKFDKTTVNSDLNTIKLNNYEINKQQLRAYLQDLFNLVVQVRKKTKSGSGDNQTLSDKQDDTTSLDVQHKGIKESLADIRLFKKAQEATFKKVELSLFSEFKKSLDPYFLNLILIENSNDYRVNKYNSLACLIAKSFEKWTTLAENLNFVKDYKISDELKIDAFVVASRHNLLLIDYIARTYQLTVNNETLLPYLKHRIKTFDAKDKAVSICSLMMHEHFSSEEVISNQFNNNLKFSKLIS